MKTQVTLKEAASLIRACGTTNTFLLVSEPGVGKSAMLTSLAEAMPRYKPVYVEAQTLDMGDLQMPKMHEDSVTFVPNTMFMPDKPNQPLLIMLDEIGKANRGVQNALLRLMHEGKLGGYSLPAGSIVFATTNNASDGVGDNMQAHALNRITTVEVSKPNADEWVEWAMDNDVDPAVLAWVREYPHALASYKDEAQKDNMYIFNPRRMQAAFVSPRSLEKASHITKNRENLSPDTLIAALAGTIGESAARDMQAFLTVADALPSWTLVTGAPKTAPMPDSPIAQTILALGAVSRLDKGTVTPWLTYMTRLTTEVQALFACQVMKSSKAPLVITNKLFTKWAIAESDLF